VAFATGCISSKTEQVLDSSYEAATEPLVESERRAESQKAAPELTASEPLDEEQVVAEAVAKSPALALMAHRARALVHAGRAEGSLPPAELGFEIWNLPLERPYSLNEAEMYMVELRQRFPAAGSLDARARALAEEAQAVLYEVAAEERLVAQGASDAFADYVQAFAEQRLLGRQRELLRRMRELAQARLSTGGSGLGALARLEVELARADRALARVTGDIARSRAMLNALLRRPATAPLGEPREVPAETVRLPIDELLARAEANRGVLLSADARVRAAEARHAAAVAEARVPEFMAGLGYWQDPTMRPGFGLTTSMSLPWFWGPGRHRVAQTEEETLAERAARDGNLIGAQAEVTQAHASLAALEEQLRVITKKALPSARRSMDALAATLSTGSSSLLEWVDVTRAVLDLELEVALLRAELARTVASLERAVGAPLPRSPVALEEGP
jgi:cobalt-zinc-cadmium efflux system outer membrane protein